MITLLADANIQGQVALLAATMQAEPWHEFWDYLGLQMLSFSDVGLVLSDSDAVVWDRCQQLGVLLITNNRNDDGPDSLESTMRGRNIHTSLPVFTIGDMRRVASSPEYRHRVVERPLQYLLEFDNIRGTGRLFLP